MSSFESEYWQISTDLFSFLTRLYRLKNFQLCVCLFCFLPKLISVMAFAQFELLGRFTGWCFSSIVLYFYFCFCFVLTPYDLSAGICPVWISWIFYRLMLFPALSLFALLHFFQRDHSDSFLFRSESLGRLKSDVFSSFVCLFFFFFFFSPNASIAQMISQVFSDSLFPGVYIPEQSLFSGALRVLGFGKSHLSLFASYLV